MMGHKLAGYDSQSNASPSPPVTYSTTASIRDRPYEGERSIAALLHMDEIVPRVLSFMTTVECLFTQSVSHSWHQHTSTARRSMIHRLHFGQFWSRVGVVDTQHLTQIASAYHSITDLNLAYCSFMTGEQFFQILRAIPDFQRIVKLNLFYCYLLTDADIEQLVTGDLLPNLRELNLGRVSKITDRCVRALADVKTLTVLNLMHNRHIGEETLMLFDDLTKFPSLQVLNIMHCDKYRMEDIEELTRTCAASGRNAQLQRKGGSNIRFIGPQELFSVDKTGKKMRKDIDADT